MNIQRHDLSTYQQDSSFYKDFSVLATVKSFDLQAIRERYLNTRSKKSNRTGSVERRSVAMGGIVQMTIGKGKTQYSEILTKMPEPRGIHVTEKAIAISSENKAFVIQQNGIHTITHPWLSYIHTVQLSTNKPNTILISSSGFDAIFEYNFLTNEKTFEWFAWENGFNFGKDPKTEEKVFLTRQIKKHEQYTETDTPHLYISDPINQTLPTARRAAFINSVVYDTKPSNLLATFFHEGAIFEINQNTGRATKVLTNLTTPHGGQAFDGVYMGTSTGSGELVTGDLTKQNRYSLSNLPGKPETLKEMEWVQNSIQIDENFVCIDSNRNALVIFNPTKKLIDFIPYNNNWAIQDITLNKTTPEILQQIAQCE